MKLSKIRVTLSGCDDQTIMDVYVTEDQLQLLTIMEKMFSDISTSVCMPRLEVKELTKLNYTF